MSKDDFLNLSNWENIFLQLDKYFFPTGEKHLVSRRKTTQILFDIIQQRKLPKNLHISKKSSTFATYSDCNTPR